MSYQLKLVQVSVPEQMANYDVAKLPGHVEVDLSILCKVVVITRWYVSNYQNLQKHTKQHCHMILNNL